MRKGQMQNFNAIPAFLFKGIDILSGDYESGSRH